MSKKSRNWTRQQRKRIKRRTVEGPLWARRLRQDVHHEVEMQRKWARFADLMAIAMREDPDRVGDNVWQVSPRRDDMSK